VVASPGIAVDLNHRGVTTSIFVGLYRLAPSTVNALTIVKPETVVRWHRAGFRSYWRWKSRSRSGRPTVAVEIRRLIREMSISNPLWGAPRIHGELLKLGIEIGQTSVAKYMVRRRQRSLNKDAPVSRPVQRTGVISSRAILGGLHHYYARV
jgi:hypothetical protein